MLVYTKDLVNILEKEVDSFLKSKQIYNTGRVAVSKFGSSGDVLDSEIV